MSFLVCEPNGESCEAIEVTRDIPGALAAIHAHVVVSEYEVEGEAVTLSNSFISFRHIKAERDLPGMLPCGWTRVYGAYLVRMGEPSITLDTKIFILEF